MEISKTNWAINGFLSDLKGNKYALKKQGLYLGQIKNLTETLIKELEETYIGIKENEK